MGLSVKTSQEADLAENGQAACPLDSPRTGRVPGLLALVAIAAALWQGSLFFGLAGGLLAIISLLLSPPRCRVLGLSALMAACVVGLRVLL